MITRKAIAVAAISLLALTACSSNGGTEGSSGSPDGNIKIGFAVPTSKATYFTAYIDAVQTRAAELGVEVTFVFAEDDANAQNTQISDFATAGVQGIVLAPVDVDANVTGVTELGDRALLITSNRFIDAPYGGIEGANPLIHVGFSDFEIGRNAGELIQAACEGKNPCNVIIQEGTLGSAPQVERTRGMEDVISSDPSIVVLTKQSNDFQQAKAIELTDQLLITYPEIDVIATHDDASAVGVSQSIAQVQRTGISVIGVGGSKDGMAAIESGALFGTVWVSPRQDGVLALEAMVAILRGDSVNDLEDVEGRPTLPVPIAQVTKANAADFPGEW